LLEKFNQSKLVKLDGERPLQLIMVELNNKIFYFTYKNWDMEHGIIATDYDGSLSYIGMPISHFKPEYKEEILKQVRERFMVR